MSETKSDVGIAINPLNANTSSSSSSSSSAHPIFTTSRIPNEGFNGEDLNRISDADSGGSAFQQDVDEKIDYVYRTPNVNFSLSQFIVEFVAHITFPLMFWYHPYAHKWLPISLAPLALYFNYFAPTFMWIMNIMAFNSKVVPLRECLLPTMFFVYHRLMVSLKYASLTPEEYAHIMHLTDVNRVNQAHQQIQILDSWHGPLRFHVFEFEIVSAAIIVGANLDQHFFLLPKAEENFEVPTENIKSFGFDNLDQLASTTPYQLWSNYLVKNLKDHSYESILTPEGAMKPLACGQLPLTEFIRSLIEFGRNHTIKPKFLYTPAIFCYGFVVSFMPLFFRLRNVIPLDSYGNVYYALSILVGFPFSVVNFMFLKYIIMDVLERKTIAAALSRLIRAESINLCDELWLQDMPTLSVKIEQNLYTWMYARLIMMNFGQRREFRRDIYMGTFLVVVSLLTIETVSQFASCKDYEDIHQTLVNPGTIQLIVFIVVTFFLIEYFIFAAAVTNDEYKGHGDIIMLNMINLESQLARKRTCDEIRDSDRKLQDAVEAMDKILEKISRSNESYCLKILGFEATLMVVWTVATTLCAIFIFIVTIIYDNLTGQSIIGNT